MVYSSPAFFGPGFDCAHIRWQWRTIPLKEYKKIVPAGCPVWDFLLLCLSSHCILPPLLHQSFIPHAVHLGIVHEQLPRSQPLAALISLHVVKELKSKCYASTQRPFKWDIKSVAVPQGLTSNFSVILFYFIFLWNLIVVWGRTQTHMHCHLKLTDISISSKSNKPTFSQDLTSDEKHMWSLVACAGALPVWYNNRDCLEWTVFTLIDALKNNAFLIDWLIDFGCFPPEYIHAWMLTSK